MGLYRAVDSHIEIAPSPSEVAPVLFNWPTRPVLLLFVLPYTSD